RGLTPLPRVGGCAVWRAERRSRAGRLAGRGRAAGRAWSARRWPCQGPGGGPRRAAGPRRGAGGRAAGLVRAPLGGGAPAGRREGGIADGSRVGGGADRGNERTGFKDPEVGVFAGFSRERARRPRGAPGGSACTAR